MSRARVLLLSSLLALASCGGGGKGSDEPKSQDDSGSSDRARQRASDDPSGEGKSWGGWRWKGRRDDCFFLFDNRCFSSFKEACSAARCKRKKDCVHDDSAPAKVSCEGDED